MLYNRAKLERDLDSLEKLDQGRSAAIANGHIGGLESQSQMFSQERAGGKVVTLGWDDMVERKRRELRMRLNRVGQLLGEISRLKNSTAKDAGQSLADAKAKLRFLRVCPTCDGFPRTIQELCTLCGSPMTSAKTAEELLDEVVMAPEPTKRLVSLEEGREAAKLGRTVHFRPKAFPNQAVVWEDV